MKLYFNDRLIAKDLKNLEEIESVMDDFMKKSHINSSGYIRWVGLNNKRTMVDYGSYTNFFYVDADIDSFWHKTTDVKKSDTQFSFSRKELFKFIKENHLQEVIEKHFKKNFTNVSTSDLSDFINQNKNRIFSIKSTVEQRRYCNQRIIDAIVELLNKHSDLRFGQALAILGINNINFDEESQQTLWKVNSFTSRAKE